MAYQHISLNIGFYRCPTIFSAFLGLHYRSLKGRKVGGASENRK